MRRIALWWHHLLRWIPSWSSNRCLSVPWHHLLRIPLWRHLLRWCILIHTCLLHRVRLLELELDGVHNTLEVFCTINTSGKSWSVANFQD